jgi:hypothetical protein
MHRPGAVASVNAFLSAAGYCGLFLYNGNLCDIAEFKQDINPQTPSTQCLTGGHFVNNFLFRMRPFDIPSAIPTSPCLGLESCAPYLGLQSRAARPSNPIYDEYASSYCGVFSQERTCPLAIDAVTIAVSADEMKKRPATNRRDMRLEAGIALKRQYYRVRCVSKHVIRRNLLGPQSLP